MEPWFRGGDKCYELFGVVLQSLAPKRRLVALSPLRNMEPVGGMGGKSGLSGSTVAQRPGLAAAVNSVRANNPAESGRV